VNAGSQTYYVGPCRERLPDHRRLVPWRVLATALLALTLAGCAFSAGTSKKLEALRSERLASAEFDGLHLLHEDEQDAKSSGETVTGKMVDAKITGVFEPDDAQALPEYLGQVVTDAKEDGWVEQFSTTTGFTGSKELDDGPARLGAVIGPCEDETCLFLYLSLQ
jgi:hypothetical protein